MTPRSAKAISLKILAEWKAKEPIAFAKWIFPVIANMPQESLMPTLEDVQPMTMPSSEIFYMDFVYNTRTYSVWWNRFISWLRRLRIM